MRYKPFVNVDFGPSGCFSALSPLTPLWKAAAGRAGHSSSSTGGVEVKKMFEFQDRIYTRCDEQSFQLAFSRRLLRIRA